MALDRTTASRCMLHSMKLTRATMRSRHATQMNATRPRLVLASAAFLMVSMLEGASDATRIPLPPVGMLTFTITPGSSTCGGPAFSPPAAAPFSGEVDNKLGTKVGDLGTGCL